MFIDTEKADAFIVNKGLIGNRLIGGCGTIRELGRLELIFSFTEETLRGKTFTIFNGFGIREKIFGYSTLPKIGIKKRTGTGS